MPDDQRQENAEQLEYGVGAWLRSPPENDPGRTIIMIPCWRLAERRWRCTTNL